MPHVPGVPDPLVMLVVYGVLLVGVLAFIRWILGDIGEFWKFLKKWWHTL